MSWHRDALWSMASIDQYKMLCSWPNFCKFMSHPGVGLDIYKSSLTAWNKFLIVVFVFFMFFSTSLSKSKIDNCPLSTTLLLAQINHQKTSYLLPFFFVITYIFSTLNHSSPMSQSIDLSKHGKELKKAYDAIVSNDPSISWAVFNYEVQSNTLSPYSQGGK